VSDFSVVQELSSSRKAASPLLSARFLSSAAPSSRTRTRREVKQVLKLFAWLQSRQEGQTMAEYGVVLAVITVAVIAALTLLSGNIEAALTRVAGAIS
jgi:Flp pilus assembly pilin Flp